MKTIKVLRSTGANLPQFTEGQVAEVEDSVATLLCQLKLAEVIQAIPEEPVKAVPDSPDIQADSDKPTTKKRKRRTSKPPESTE